METVEVIKEWATIPTIGILGFLAWKLIEFAKDIKATADKGVENHLHTIQQNTQTMHDGIQELKAAADKTLFHLENQSKHLERQTELLTKIAEK